MWPRLRSLALVAIAALAAACNGTEKAPRAKVHLTQARQHGAVALVIRNALTRGDLAAARASARTLEDVTFETERHPALHPRVDAMVRALRGVATAEDTQGATRALGPLATTCGDCHGATGGPAPSTVEALPPAPDRMLSHAWGADRLWEGLTVPSSDAWSRGALALQGVRLVPDEEGPGREPTPQVVRFANRIQALGREAAGARSTEEREKAYAAVVTTCASCHRTLGGGPE